MGESREVPGPTTSTSAPTRRVVVVVFDRFQSLDALGPIEVFDHANGSLRRPAYRLELAAPAPGPVAASSGVTLAVEHALHDIVGPIDTLVIAGGLGVYRAVRDPEVVAHIGRLAAASRRVTSVCTGAYLLAEAGLLTGHRVTTHWMSCDDLQSRYPDLEVDPEPIFIREGNLATSAGVTAGMDLALHLVEEDHGHALALEVARSLVLFLRRPGTQAQLSAVLAHQATTSAPLRDLQHWVVDNLDQDLTVARLAARVHQSPRTFARRFRDDVGTTPARWVEGLRLEEARRLLETTTDPVDQVARRCGLQPEAIRRLFHRTLGVGPSEYRRRFGTPLGAASTTTDHDHHTGINHTGISHTGSHRTRSAS
jgi:transcriptional regulator GlxA family with amidase domain